MSISFPIARADFWDLLEIEAINRFEIVYNQRTSVDGGGNVLVSQFGDGRWVADIVLGPMYFSDAVRIEALIHMLIARNGSFLAYDLRRAYPVNDPQGSAIATVSPQVKTKGSNNRSLSLKNFKNGLTITVGERLSVRTTSGQKVLLEVLESFTGSGGDTVEFEVVPYLPVGIAVNDPVDFIKPVGNFKIVPGSYKGSTSRGNIAYGISFSMYSVLTSQ